MKKCPNCASVYNDDMMIKCTNCGADLVEEKAEQPNFNSVPPQNNYANYNYNSYGNQQFKYCTRCGNQCDPRAVICVKCGMQFNDMYSKIPTGDDKPSGGLKFLCFLIPIVGLILYLVNMKDKPISAKAYGKMALIGFIIGIILYVALIIFLVVIFPVIFSTALVDPYYDYYNTYGDSEIFYSIANMALSLFK